MRLPRVRFTIRRMMVMVACVAVGLYLAVTAWQTSAYRPHHIHTAIMAADESPGTYTGISGCVPRSGLATGTGLTRLPWRG